MESQNEADNCGSLFGSPPALLNIPEIILHRVPLPNGGQLKESATGQDLPEQSDDLVEAKNRIGATASLKESTSPSTHKPSKPLTKRNIFHSIRNQDEKFRNPRLYGWRATVFSCSVTSTSILIINIVLLIWGVTKFGHNSGESIFYTGDCKKAQRLSTLLHVLINVLSTILLSASNYTMQCLHSPTRAEVDRAHAQKTWVDIGVSSWRNRRFVSLKNRVLWWGLGLSSLPLHFIYNSTVFLETWAQEYQADFTNSTVSQLIQDNAIPSNTTCVEFPWQKCMSVYTEFMHDYGDVIYIAPYLYNTDPETTEIYSQKFMMLDNMSLAFWIIPNGINSPYVELSMPGISYNVTSCCAKPTMSTPCRLKFDIAVMSTVIICNAVKAICMFLVILKAKDYPLVTLGDAIASFLETPDLTTRYQCLISKSDVLNGDFKKGPSYWKKWKHGSERLKNTQFYAVSARCWACVNFFFIASFITLLVVLVPLIDGSGIDTTLRPANFTTFTWNIAGWGKTGSLLLVNLPQAVVSLMTVLYNRCPTSIFLMETWNSFSQKPKALHVTVPLGKQKSQYYLTIPYQYAIPLLLLTSSFHWSISDSIFLVSIKAIRDTQELPRDSVYGFGYSSLSILISALICFVLIAMLTWKALRKYVVRMPVAGGCSVVISAACHKRVDDEAPQLDKVMWGVVKQQDSESWGHCGFGSKVVEPPVPGLYYF